MKKVFCFGVFDGIHEGHVHMLKQAKSLGDYLIVALTQDHIVEHLKKHKPRHSLTERINAVESLHIADKVIGGDQEIKMWKTLQEEKPDIVALGYDQIKLKTALDAASRDFNFSPQIIVMQPHRPDELHSSLLTPDTL